ncbi:MAG TPA: acetyltransferase [Actinomycetes bacterium]|nr:acetyltransferase [Actinomycetes bacterium]
MGPPTSPAATRPPPELVLVGAGGFARETAEAVRAVNARAPTWELLGFVDDDPRLGGTRVDGLPVLGPLTELRQLPHAQVVVCTGHPGNYFSRKLLVGRLALAPERFATVVHPTSVLPPAVRVGGGSVLLAGVVATTAVSIGAHVAVMPGVVLTHDDVVEDYATLAAGVRLAGGVRVGQGAYVGAGVLVRERRTVGAWSLVGMGAVVLDDVPPAEVRAGVPARRLRSVDVPPGIS